ncbi:hypothetical protein H257_12395 [Aphanomyces astaci]|uniref:Uncharacterized protein n=1 Tax=Aphanomyces astaci TaxID=112090 RepID=W4FYW0_APHAT|nr:hypothetical protein H257_12395 [Aphanomyces astaci]ETV72647.1 hypothetical protein H257_12395 [Aphanomyces astaci]|eukprot:XP_009837875.1 hypothetical protein H257_12395 [Aphanomyces astaci]
MQKTAARVGGARLRVDNGRVLLMLSSRGLVPRHDQGSTDSEKWRKGRVSVHMAATPWREVVCGNKQLGSGGRLCAVLKRSVVAFQRCGWVLLSGGRNHQQTAGGCTPSRALEGDSNRHTKGASF